MDDGGPAELDEEEDADRGGGQMIRNDAKTAAILNGAINGIMDIAASGSDTITSSTNSSNTNSTQKTLLL